MKIYTTPTVEVISLGESEIRTFLFESLEDLPGNGTDLPSIENDW